MSKGSDRARPGDRTTPGDWAPLGLWTGGGLALLLWQARLVAARRAAGSATAAVEAHQDWAAAQSFPSSLALGLAAGLVAAGLARRAPPAAGPWRELAVTAAVALPIGLALAVGVPPPGPVPGELALDGAGVQAAIAVVAARVLRAARGACRSEGWARALLAGRAALAVALVAAVLAPTAGALALASRPPTRPVRELVRDLTTEPRALEVVEHPAGAPPAAARFAPALYEHTPGEERAALWLAPPAEVRFRVPPGDGPVVLAARLGVDAAVRRALRPGAGAWDVWCELVVDGELRALARLTVTPWEHGASAAFSQGFWIPLGEPGGVRLAPGADVAVRTRASPRPHLAPEERLVGVAGLALLRERHVPVDELVGDGR